MDRTATHEDNLRAFKGYLTNRGYKPTTIRGYVREIAAWLADGRPAQAYLNAVHEGSRDPASGLPTTRARQTLKALRAYHDACDLAAQGRALTVPRAHRVRRPNRGRALTRAEEAHLRRTLADEPVTTRALVGLMLDLGLRVTEACHLQMIDLEVDRTAGGLVVIVREGKGRSLAAGDPPERLGAPADLAITLGTYLKSTRARLAEPRGQSPWLFPSPGVVGRPRSERGVRALLERLGRRCGIPDLHPHMLRHTLATRLTEAGCGRVDVRAVLRHKGGSVTDGYIHLEPRAIRAILARRS